MRRFISDNKPVYTGDQTINKFDGTDIIVRLTAEDPDFPGEGNAVTFSSEKSVSGVTLSSTGVFTWSSQSDASLNVVLVDSCGATVRQQISLVRVPCPCQNAGTCVSNPEAAFDASVFQCRCARGTSGQRCEVIAQWSEWQAWSECTPRCGFRSRSRMRECSDAADTCQGEDTERETCTSTYCIGKSRGTITVALLPSNILGF